MKSIAPATNMGVYASLTDLGIKTMDQFESQTTSDENQEALETEERPSEIEVPFDPSKIDIIVVKMTMGSLLDRLVNDELDLTPDFQRQANLWDAKRKSRLIESVLLKIPLPSFYFSENSEGVYSVVDGLQRLCTLFHFVQPDDLNRVTQPQTPLSKFELTDLQYLKELKGKIFDELDRPLQRRIRELEITTNIIRANTPAAVKFNVFARLNQGGLPLNAQEIRNAIYPGSWRRELDEMAQCEAFLNATERKIKTDRQEDLELVLRFVSLWQLPPPFKRPVDQPLLDNFLNDQLEKAITRWSSDEWVCVKSVFSKALIDATEIFGRHVFRKSSGVQTRTPINRGLFEAQLLTLSTFNDYEIGLLKSRKELVQQSFKAELNNINSPLARAVQWNTASSEASNKRIEELLKIFQGVINADQDTT